MLVNLASAGDNNKTISIHGDHIIIDIHARFFKPGELIIFEISPFKENKIETVSGMFLDTEMEFYPEGEKWFALFGIPTKLEPGLYPITISAVNNIGDKEQLKQNLRIDEREFSISELNVDPYYLKYTEEKLKRIRKEAAILMALWKKKTPDKYWNGSFIKPVDDLFTQEFAVKRVFNGEYRSFHSGSDLKASIGTPVAAVNRGKVVMCDDFYFSGKFIVIDHGRRVYSFYAHLSEFKVKEGDFVNKGDIIALSGDTGRITGPHLHWTMKINSVNVDPEALLELGLY
ncbi:MAG: M23 family metallopeptidase [Acidobacteria bacterium]|nr:M23 family metallopeptidase [Acidobacteriota bacterium]